MGAYGVKVALGIFWVCTPLFRRFMTVFGCCLCCCTIYYIGVDFVIHFHNLIIVALKFIYDLFSVPFTFSLSLSICRFLFLSLPFLLSSLHIHLLKSVYMLRYSHSTLKFHSFAPFFKFILLHDSTEMDTMK